ncbi:MAG: ABC transporter ATP-binding protein [Oscillospiraceae bacterium]|nr:ABC transporter ATP-binding protein [Oscillospiraceae bacterium]
MRGKLLKVSDLVVHYELENEVVEAVNGVSFEMNRGETLGIVGETGAGKTTLALSIMRLVPEPPGRVVQGTIALDGENVLSMAKREIRQIRGKKVSMIFQDPMTSLNPVQTVGNQIMEVIKLHENCSAAEAVIRATEMLERVGIPGERFNEYPHQFSGGMRQRVVIAIALACSPELLIADEPTTALDVTIQAQILDMMRRLKDDLNTSMIMITHDLGVVAETCDKVAIMYAGELVEYGTVEQIFHRPKHPYTVGLFRSLPSLDKDVDRLQPIPGLMPDPTKLPNHCSFYDRCEEACDDCLQREPPVVEPEPGHTVRCCRCSGGERREAME